MQYANCHLFSAKAVKQPAQHNFLCLLKANSYFPTAPFPAADTVQTKKRKAPCALPFFLFVMATAALVPMPTTAMCSACLFMIVMAMVVLRIAALRFRVILERSIQIRLSRCICTARYAAIKANARLFQRLLRSRANASADQHICALRL